MKLGAVAIGRDEGERLRRCLQSLTRSEVSLIVYVDSGSTDGSVGLASAQGVVVVELDPRIPFTAARARNAGFERLRQIATDLRYVQFIDGDCELVDTWVSRAARLLDSRPDVAAVAGRLHERHPERSVYNWLCDREWEGPTGEVRACGGIAILRSDAFSAVGGFRKDLIAGEEPELCIRLRAAGWRIWRLGDSMALHDAAILQFRQWWKRSVRAGYAYAEGAYLHGAPPERHRVWEVIRGWIWGIFIPLLCLVVSLLLWPWGLTTWMIYLLQVLRQTARNRGPIRDRALLAVFQGLARFAEVVGQIKFLHARMLGRRSGLIEYK